MFIGHFAVAFAAKKAAPKVPLGALFIGAQFLDLLWPVCVLMGLETVRIHPGDTAVTPLEFVSYPWSHSLLLAIFWGVLLGFAVLLTRSSKAGAAVAALLVVSHWVLDWITHRPDLQLWPGSPSRYGLGLWNSLPWTLAVEGALFVAGIALYARATAASSRAGRWGLWLLVGFLAAIYLASVFGPTPPSAEAVAWSGVGMWLLVFWGYWLDGRRRVVPPAEGAHS
jgi:hypothetical protein